MQQTVVSLRNKRNMNRRISIFVGNVGDGRDMTLECMTYSASLG